jgi:hypothetical protein
MALRVSAIDYNNDTIIVCCILLYILIQCSLLHESMSRNILTELRDKNQNAKNDLYDLLDKPYYVDSIKYKFDDTAPYLESSTD